MAITGVNVKYGDYVFKPAPILSYERETYAIKNNGNIIGGTYNINLEGTLIPEVGAEGGALEVFRAQELLHESLKVNYKEFTAQFLGSEECEGYVVSGRPVVNSISLSTPDNYTRRANYSIGLSFAGSSISGEQDYLATGLNLEDAQTNYSFSYRTKPTKFYGIEFPPILEIQRSVSAVGQTISTGELVDGTALCVSGLTNAINYVTGVATMELNNVEVNSLLSLGTEITYGYKTYLTDRTVSQDQTAGSFSVDDTFIAVASGMPQELNEQGNPEGIRNLPSGIDIGPPSGYVSLGAFPVEDTFNFNVERNSQDGIVSVSMDGTVQGYPTYRLTDGSFSLLSDSGAFDVARAYTAYCLNSGIFENRAGIVYSGAIGSTLSGVRESGFNHDNYMVSQTPLEFNKKPLSESYGYNIKEGTVSYNISYNNRPKAIATGVFAEQINITKNNPTDVHAVITVLGRAAGPILQDIGTKTAYTQDISISASVVPSTGYSDFGLFFDPSPTLQYGDLILSLEKSISGADNTIFKTADNETFDIKTGRYTRQASWIYTSCPSDDSEET